MEDKNGSRRASGRTWHIYAATLPIPSCRHEVRKTIVIDPFSNTCRFLAIELKRNTSHVQDVAASHSFYKPPPGRAGMPVGDDNMR